MKVSRKKLLLGTLIAVVVACGWTMIVVFINFYWEHAVILSALGGFVVGVLIMFFLSRWHPR